MAALIAFIWSLVTKSKPTPKNRYSLPFPKQSHVVLGDDFIKDKALFVVGDVHGCYDELVELLELAAKEVPNKVILPIFVGDIINKGPKNIDVLRKLRNMESFVVRGNHEEVVLREVLRHKLDESYEHQVKYDWIDDLTDDDVTYLQELPYTLSIPSFNAIIVHAGLVPETKLENQDFKNMVSMRNLEKINDAFIATSKVHKGEDSEELSKPWGSVWNGPEHVYFGHDATRKLQKYSYATGLDTGCVYGGELTGVFLNSSKKLISVKAKRTYKAP